MGEDKSLHWVDLVGPKCLAEPLRRFELITRVFLLLRCLTALLSAASTSTATVYRIDNPFPSASAAFATAVAGAGDQNGDGIPDLVVGAPGADRADITSLKKQD